MKYLFLFAALGISLTAFVPVTSDCRDQITQAYRTLADATTPGQTRVLHMRFVTETTYRVPGKATERQSKTVGELYVKGRQLYYETPNLKLWQDGRLISSALRPQRVVLLTRVPPTAEKATVQPLLLLRDSLIHSATVQLCRQETVNGHPQQHIRLGLAAAVTARFGLQTLDFRLGGEPVRVQQIIGSYQPGRTAQRIVLSFQTQEWLPASAMLTNNAKQPILDPSGKLLPAFAGYRLIDQTKSSSTLR